MTQAYFTFLGFVDKDLWHDYVCHNPNDNRNYKIKIPLKYYNANGPFDNVKSLGWLCRVCGWEEDSYSILPELPVNLIPILIPTKVNIKI
jgi:hypothetical protein